MTRECVAWRPSGWYYWRVCYLSAWRRTVVVFAPRVHDETRNFLKLTHAAYLPPRFISRRVGIGDGIHVCLAPPSDPRGARAPKAP